MEEEILELIEGKNPIRLHDKYCTLCHYEYKSHGIGIHSSVPLN